MFVKGGPFLNRTASGRYRALIKKGMPKLVYWTDGRRIVFILCGTPETKTRRIPHPVEDYGSHVATPTILSTASFFSLSLTTVYVTKNAATTTQHPHNHKNKIGSNTARSQVALFAKIKWYPMLGELNGIMTSKSRLFRRGEQLVRDIKKAFNFGGEILDFGCASVH